MAAQNTTLRRHRQRSAVYHQLRAKITAEQRSFGAEAEFLRGLLVKVLSMKINIKRSDAPLRTINQEQEKPTLIDGGSAEQKCGE